MAYADDSGGIFASDTHRRVLAHLHDDPQPIDGPAVASPHKVYLGHRLSQDAYHGLAEVGELEEVLADLEADGYASESKDGWKLTKKGLEALQAPLPEEPQGPATPVVLDGLGTGGTGGLNG